MTVLNVARFSPFSCSNFSFEKWNAAQWDMAGYACIENMLNDGPFVSKCPIANFNVHIRYAGHVLITDVAATSLKTCTPSAFQDEAMPTSRTSSLLIYKDNLLSFQRN